MKKIKRMVYTIIAILFVMVVKGCIVIQQPQFGKNPRGARLERIKASPNYKNGKFQNLRHTPLISSDKGALRFIWSFLFGKKDEELRPKTPIPTQKTDLFSIKADENVLVWLGHSSYFIQMQGKKYLVDPMLVSATLMPFGFKMFKGAAVYQPGDIPPVDYLIITHDHYDHLDYKTMKALKNNIGRVITALGVGEHFEYWGFPAERITELDWNEAVTLNNDITITALPARHSSGRSLIQKKTLWASFMLQTTHKTIYIANFL